MEDPARIKPPDAAADARPIRLVSPGEEGHHEGILGSYRRLADVFHDVLAETTLDALLERIADTLAELVPYEALHVYEADDANRELVPALVRSEWAEEILKERFPYGQGITGWAVENREPVLANRAHLDPRVHFVPGTPVEPEALIAVPLIARGRLKGTLNIYRIGEDAAFSEEEFELAKRFGDAAALALDNAHIRARLEHQAQTDSLTGLYNHRTFHDRLRFELTRASAQHHSVAVVMLDIDDFKKVNDVYGHGVGDTILAELADILRATVRASDVVCRIGGEEFAVIVPRAERAHALALAHRLAERLEAVEFELAGSIAVSIGIAHGPEHAANPRELAACAEAAMMTAKARGKNQVVLFEDGGTTERPVAHAHVRREEVRQVAHLKLLQSLAGKLNRLSSVSEIGLTIANELRGLIDYHNCRVFLRHGDDLRPIAFRGELTATPETAMEILACRVGEGITGRVAETGEPLLIPDAAQCEYSILVPGTKDIEESLLAVPLDYGARTIGVVVVSKLGTNQFDEDDLRLLEVLAGHAAVALENARLYESQRREAETATALLEFSRELAEAEGLEAVLEQIVESSARLLGSTHTSFWLQHAPDGDLRARAAWGYDGGDRAHLFGRSIPAAVLEGFRERTAPYLVEPKDYTEIVGPPRTGNGRFAVAPLQVEGRWGAIVAAAPSEEGLGERELDLLGGLAHQAKLAVANAWSFAGLERTFITTVEALANALEANDQYTSTHARWITDTAIRVGVELGLDARALKRLQLGALLHDIGKLGIPSTILSKPGPLTPGEREIVETHPALGERILAPIEQLQEVRPIVRACHERWDGSGYPDGRQGEEIPLEARIIFACDAFHAMTTDRPYRLRLPVEEALRRLEAGAGSQFDPRVIEVCLRVLAPAPLAGGP
jgi:diguanylate cyclase (GGDEF)-like protein